MTLDYLRKTDAEETIEETCFMLCNPFNAVNVGHDLSITLDRLHEYLSMKLECPLVFPEAARAIPRVVELVQAFLPDRRIIFLQDDVVYKFKRVFITKNCVFDILKYPYIITAVRRAAMSKIPNLSDYAEKKIFMVKTTKNRNVVSPWSCFEADRLMETLEKEYGWICINPEKMSMLEIVAYLFQASKIVTSFGAIVYGNGIFFNPYPVCKRYFISQGHSPYYDVEKYKIIEVKSNNLDLTVGQIIKQLEE
jgi:hypothetical protein